MPSDAPTIDVLAIEPREGGGAVRVRVRSQFGDFHLEIPVGQVSDLNRARDEAKKTLHRFFNGDQEMLIAVDDMQFRSA
jgi:hypothetical protein